MIQVTGLITLRIQRATFAARVAGFVERVRHAGAANVARRDTK